MLGIKQKKIVTRL